MSYHPVFWRGGADAYVTPPSGLIYRKPREVAQWVVEIEAALNHINLSTLDFIGELHSYLNDPLTPPAHKTFVDSAFNMGEVIAVKDFKDHSSLPGEFRSGRIKEMDIALADYHRAGNWVATGAYTKKMKAIYTIANQGFSYLEETIAAKNSAHNRRLGVVGLVASIVGMIGREDSKLGIFLGNKFLGTEIENATRIRMQFHDLALAPDDGIKAKNR